MRHLQDLNNKHILVMGLGLTGQSVLRFLNQLQTKLDITVAAADSRTALPESLLKTLTVPVQLGAFTAEQCQAADVLVVSPGISIAGEAIQTAQKAGVIVLGDIELFALFYNEYLAKDCRLVAVTGSNGKSSVVTLVRDMLQQSNQQVLLGGNIGTPALDLLNNYDHSINENGAASINTFVLELSSFQLETTSSLVPNIACVLNVSDDHMDRYSSFAEYAATKRRIYANSQYNLYNVDDAQTYVPANCNQASSASFSVSENKASWGVNSQQTHILFNEEPFLNASDLAVVGRHNLQNVQAAAAIATHLGVDATSIREAASAFAGLPHRCQLVANKRGIHWINDSKATNAGATIAAILGLRSLVSGRLALIAGGDSKAADLEPLRAVLAEHVDLLFAFGKDAAKLALLTDNHHHVGNLDEAVTCAANWGRSGDWILLSPACASLDMFKNYEHRGTCFVAAVEALS